MLTHMERAENAKVSSVIFSVVCFRCPFSEGKTNAKLQSAKDLDVPYY